MARLLALLLALGLTVAHGATPKPTPKPTASDNDESEPTEGPSKGKRIAAVSTITSSELDGFSSYPTEVQRLIEDALALTRRGLTYTFGSSNPEAGGMDCSGTVYHLLHSQGIKSVPRQSDEIARWVRDTGSLQLTPGATGFDDALFANLEPGDLMFWTGTYNTGKRALPVSHVMVYLGKRQSDQQRLVFGASDGRYYQGQRRCGVSVFDLSFPKASGTAAFYGYGAIPGLAKAKPRETIRRPLITVTSKPDQPQLPASTPEVKPKPSPATSSTAKPKKPLAQIPAQEPAEPTTEPKPSPQAPAKKPSPPSSQASTAAPAKPASTTSKPKPNPASATASTTKPSTTKGNAGGSKSTASSKAAPTKPKSTSSAKARSPSKPTLKLPPGLTRNAKRLADKVRGLFD